MLAEIWEEIVTCLKMTLSVPGYQTFLSSTEPVSFSDNILVVKVPTLFSKEWIKEKCEPVIRSHFAGTAYQTMILSYTIEEFPPLPEIQTLPLFAKKPVSFPDPVSSKSTFIEKYTFENFIVGHHNRFAHAASEAVAKTPAKAYNPLFIYGAAGLGKTHLLHAIGLKTLALFPALKACLVSSERFTNDLINSIKDKKMEAFRERYRSVDLLLIDDIQFLAGKEQTQEEFFHTFNDLHSNNKQIVITSDRPPKEIPTLEERLRTRFGWGLIADIQPPELETRIAILRKKIELNSFTVSDEILHFIATQIPTNVREMEGALTRIVAYASLLSTEVTLSIASNVIRDMIGVKQEKPLTVSFIKRKVCDYFSISETELCSKTRTKEVAFARQIGMYLSRELTPVSLPKLGEAFGNRDHTTVMHACDKIKSGIDSDPETKNIVEVLLTQIKAPD